MLKQVKKIPLFLLCLLLIGVVLTGACGRR